MTTDPALKTLFAASERTFEDENFTDKVMKKSRFVRFRTHIIVGVGLFILAVALTFLSSDVQSLIIQFNNVLTSDIFDLGEGVTAVALDPINTIAGIVFIVIKGTHMIYKWVTK